jgi:hypothetical protein
MTITAAFRWDRRLIEVYAERVDLRDVVAADYDRVFEQAREGYFATGAIAIDEYGSRSIIGLSDLDLVVVYPDDAVADRSRLSSRVYEQLDRRIVQHPPLVIPAGLFGEWEWLHPGAHDVRRLEQAAAANRPLFTVFACEGLIDHSRRLQLVHERGSATSRQLLADLNSLGYSFRLVDALTRSVRCEDLGAGSWLSRLNEVRTELIHGGRWTQQLVAELGDLAENARPLARRAFRRAGSVAAAEASATGESMRMRKVGHYAIFEEPDAAAVVTLMCGELDAASNLGRAWIAVTQRREAYGHWLRSNGFPDPSFGVRLLSRRPRSRAIGFLRRQRLFLVGLPRWLQA